MMKKLTQYDDQGNWCLKGVRWEQLHVGSIITKEVEEKLYGALCKLRDYENTDLSPEEVERVNDFSKSQASRLMKELQEEREKHRWIPVCERLPKSEGYVLVSFENFTLPDIARYEVDENGSGAFYPGDEDESYISFGLFVNAWMPLPEPYREENDEPIPAKIEVDNSTLEWLQKRFETTK